MPAFSTPQEFLKLVSNESNDMARIIKEANIKVD